MESMFILTTIIDLKAMGLDHPFGRSLVSLSLTALELPWPRLGSSSVHLVEDGGRGGGGGGPGSGTECLGPRPSSDSLAIDGRTECAVRG